MLRHSTLRARALSRRHRDFSHRDVVVERHEVHERHFIGRLQRFGHSLIQCALDDGEQKHFPTFGGRPRKGPGDCGATCGNVRELRGRRGELGPRARP